MVNLINKSRARLNEQRLIFFLNKILKKASFDDKIINLVLTDKQGVRQINKTYRGENKVTDVISYKASDGKFVVKDKEAVFGEIIVSYPVAKEQARELGMAVLNRILVLFIHGFVHILGYDHEKSALAASKMLKKEKEFLDLFKN